VKGLAAMKMGPKAPPEEEPEAPADDTKTAALRECIAALKDGDEEGAAQALGAAVKACMAEYDEEE
jgi:DNA-binding GntR family transcriptional regulator